MIIRIKDLRLRTIIGIHDWEREHRQDVTINVGIRFDGSQAAKEDRIESTIDYKNLTKTIIERVEGSEFLLLERLAHEVLRICKIDDRVDEAWVEIDKPQALRFADSVSVTARYTRSE